MNKVTGSILTVALGFIIGSCLFGLGIRYAREHGQEIYNKEADVRNGTHVGGYFRQTFIYYGEMDSTGRIVSHSKAAARFFESDSAQMVIDSALRSKR